MKLSIKTEWEKFRREVIRLDTKLESGDGPIPTIQMCELLIAGEDHRFRSHSGVDLIGLMRAIWKTLVFRERQGGSTIAMQFVRTITGRYEKTLKRKIYEIIFAVLLTHHFGRDRLPMWYLCIAYYGWRMNNFRQACTRLRIKPDSIDEIEAARLVARLKYPEPAQCKAERIRKIERRARHLVALKNQCETIGELYATIQNCSATSTPH
jgi:membrane peptidoglycan carboxypeptidase